ncbi:MAG: universal stress protein [Blastocatellia bacterium]|nr:universal stress protein [Blastocatellia bacterium]
MKVLIAVDGSPHGEAAIRSVAKRPWPAGSEARVISVVDWTSGPGIRDSLPRNILDEMEEAGCGRARGIADRAIAIFREHETQVMPIDQIVVVGPAKTAILDEAERWGADLIVLGSHGYRGYRRFLLGSVSQAIAAQARCSVEIVRTPAIAAES